MICIIILCFVTYAFQFFFGGEFTWDDVKGWTIFNFYLGLPFYFANGFLNDFLDRLYPWDSKAIPRLGIGIVAACLMNVTLLYGLLIFYFGIIKGKGIQQAIEANYANSFGPSALVIVLVITLIFYCVMFFKRMQEEKLINAKLRTEKADAELNALKSQLDPHFLFNSFNVLSGLIDEDSKKAQHFLGDLSKIYRYVLEKRDTDLTTLAEEMDFAKKYLSLLSTRFEDGLKVNIGLNEDSLKKKVPTFSLQLLLENVVKHNKLDKEAPLTVNISATHKNLVVKNEKKSRSTYSSVNGSSETTGLGLENIKQRYALYQVEGFQVVDGQDVFEVNLPLI